MTLTVYSNLSLIQIAENLKTLRGYSVKVEKISNNLNKILESRSNEKKT